MTAVFEVSPVSVSCIAVTDGDSVLNEETVVAVRIDSSVKLSVFASELFESVLMRSDDVSCFMVDSLDEGMDSTIVVSLLITLVSVSETADAVTGDVAVDASVL